MKLRLEAARQLEGKGRDGATLLSNRCQFSSCCCTSCRASFVFPFSHLRRFLPFWFFLCLARISVLFSCRPSPFPATSNNPPLSLWSSSWTTASSHTHGSMLSGKSWEPRLVTRNQVWWWGREAHCAPRKRLHGWEEKKEWGKVKTSLMKSSRGTRCRQGWRWEVLEMAKQMVKTKAEVEKRQRVDG